ncbi:hypothetical protein Nepgr_011487 [Nepenthes gracilis]|uniref:Pentatricopeptide repeat-containing protein n=1 Tax=Nepenthes gracilis TaxID=150966 RepID=A0AAD3XMF6_NEPGR|nr:hypothetical protein Nepgr_011487 [Nepenthes gracilis]
MHTLDYRAWTSNIRTHSIDAKEGEVLSLFLHNVRHPFGFKPDHLVFAAVFKACAALSALSLGRALHSCAVKLGQLACLSVSKGLLNMYAKSKKFDDCEKLFGQMPKSDTVVWNILLSGLSGSQIHDAEVMRLFQAMLTYDEPKPSSVTVAIILPVCTRMRNSDAGKSIHSYVMKSGMGSDTLVGNALVSMYAKFGLADDDGYAAFHEIEDKDVISWNAMIAGLAENGLNNDAYELFRHMLWGPTKPNYTTVASALTFCGTLDKYVAHLLGRELHAYVLRRAELQTSFFVINALMSFYLRIGRMEAAETLFESMTSRDLVSWNAIIAGYTLNNDCFRALQLFNELISHQMVQPDYVTLISILPACAHLCDLQVGKQIHGYVIRHPALCLCTEIHNALISFYAKCGDLDSSFHTFMMTSPRDLISCNTMLDAFAGSGCELKLLDLLDWMHKVGSRPDSITMLTLVQFYGTLCRSSKVKEAHGYLLRAGLLQRDVDSSLENAILDAYAKCGKIEYASKIFGILSCGRACFTFNSALGYAICGTHVDGCKLSQYGPKKDLSTWNLMVHVCAENCHPDVALGLFQELQVQGIKPDAASIMSILPVCARTASGPLLRQCHGYAVRTCLQDAYLMGNLIDVYSKCGSISSAHKLFQSSSNKDLVMFTAMICGYAMHGMGEEALKVFSRMLDLGIRPDHVIITAVLSACSHAGLVDEGLGIFHSLGKVHGIKPTMEHYACIVDLLARGGRVRDAYSFVIKMPVEADANIWSTLLGACRTYHEVELGKIVADRVFDLEANDIGSYVAMSNLHAAGARWDDVVEMRELMKTRDLKKPAGCSWIEVDMRKNVFTSSDLSHLETKTIYNTLRTLDQQVKERLIFEAVNFGG